MSIKKKALLVGVSYEGSDMELKGTKNDTIRLRQKLIEKFGYKSENITMLIEHAGYKPPIGNNILNALIKLIIAARRGEVHEVCFNFSGHGCQIPDKAIGGDEVDGLDECLVPLNHEKGVITDDKLAHYFRYFPRGCTVIAITDCCHSGSVLDLRYEMQDSGEIVTVNNHSRHSSNILQFSGCRDHECSLDVVQRTGRYFSWGGLMTYSILQILDESDQCITWLELLQKSRAYIKKKGYPQIPQLTCSKVLTEDTKVCESHDGGVTFDFTL